MGDHVGIQQTTMNVAPATMMLVFVTWTVITATAAILVRKKSLSRKVSALLLAISTITGGFVLGALPNPIQPINQLLLASRGVGVNTTLVPMVVVLGALLASTALVGRAFCGHACPLGAMQELLSRAKYKASVTDQRHVTGRIVVPERVARLVRVAVLFVLAAVTLAWGISIIQLTSPFLGFRVFVQPGITAIAIPIITLVAIAVTSVFVYRPWCRLACPFGTLAWVTSRASKYKLRRTGACTDCGLCEQVCPVDEVTRGASKAGCFLCNRCVEACPNGAIAFDSKEDATSKEPTTK